MDVFALTILATIAGTVASTYLVRYIDKKSKKNNR